MNLIINTFSLWSSVILCGSLCNKRTYTEILCGSLCKKRNYTEDHRGAQRTTKNTIKKSFLHHSFTTNSRIAKLLVFIAIIFSCQVVTAQNPIIKIGLLADIQYCPCETAFSREYSKSLGKVEEAVALINKESVNFTISLGDMIDRDYQNFEPVIKRLNTLNSKWIFIPGNHDFNVGHNMKKNVLNMIPAKKGYWSEVIGDLRLLYLNGFAKKVVGWNGALGSIQLAWIKSEVEKANQAHQKIIVFAHQLIVPGDSHSLLESSKMVEILSGSQHSVLYICGHKHSGSDHTLGNIRVLNLKGMVEQKETSFGVLSLYPERWELKGFGGQESNSGTWK